MDAIRSAGLARAKKVAVMLRKKYGAKKVLLFGSLVRDGYLDERTDIDILVDGVSVNDMLRAGFDAWMVAEPFDVDLVPAGKAHRSLLKVARKEGIEL
ncbi:MAG TPA: nucleotidyltransferase domain-containing protein [Syntrophorhabdaceae bacterium]|nr:nucleotidyltransferase domain-containing protein [Syntrophorhabdaceae bacterium]